MKACTFFGHRDCFDDVSPVLYEIIVDLITQKDVTVFYVGNQGGFDGIVHHVLKDLAQKYSIQYAVVLAYLPGEKTEYDDYYSDTMLPEGIEAVHPRYAIDWRNKWMIDHSDYVITYVKHGWGGAAKYAALAERKGKVIIPTAT